LNGRCGNFRFVSCLPKMAGAKRNRAVVFLLWLSGNTPGLCLLKLTPLFLADTKIALFHCSRDVSPRRRIVTLENRHGEPRCHTQTHTHGSSCSASDDVFRNIATVGEARTLLRECKPVSYVTISSGSGMATRQRHDAQQHRQVNFSFNLPAVVEESDQTLTNIIVLRWVPTQHEQDTTTNEQPPTPQTAPPRPEPPSPDLSAPPPYLSHSPNSPADKADFPRCAYT